MAGEELDAAHIGKCGIDGDRRLALRRLNALVGFPWLTASKLPELLLFTPVWLGDGGSAVPTHVRTPEGVELPVFSDALADEIGGRYGTPVQMTQIDEGIFDDSAVSVITSATVDEIGKLTGRDADVRRFRPNVVVRQTHPAPFRESEWVGGVLLFGDGHEAPEVRISSDDARCSMVNLDPDSAAAAPEILKTIVRVNQNNAGVYASVARAGRIAVGQAVTLRR